MRRSMLRIDWRSAARTLPLVAGLTFGACVHVATGAPRDPSHAQGITGPFYGGAVTTLGDMTGDDLSEVAVAAPMADGPLPGCGVVYVKYSTPFNNKSDTVLYGEQTNGYFGGSIAGVGDVNGDGYPDLLVGEPDVKIGNEYDAGRAFLYLGGPSGISATPAWTFATGESLAFVGTSVGWTGDLNGDGYDDWVVGAPGHSVNGVTTGAVYVFFGGPGPLPTSPSWTYVPTVGARAGASVAGAGDVNGDGYADLIVGAPLWSKAQAYEGAALLFLGHAGLPSAQPDKAWYGGQSQAQLGWSVATAGDVNGDGYADMIVGSPFMSDPAPYSGEAFIFHGGPFPPAYTAVDSLATHHQSDEFGMSVATAGDVNGDGFADVIVGAPYAPGAGTTGEAVVYGGTASGVQLFPALYYLGTQTAGELCGFAVGTMGDVNGDGISDIWAGSPGTNGGGETVSYVVLATYYDAQPLLAGQGYSASAALGQTAVALDVNGDGYDDLLAGAVSNEASLRLWYGGPHAFLPAAGAPDTAATPDWTYPPTDFVGYALVAAGDVNGDGYADFLTGAPYHSTATQDDIGMATLFYGSPTGPQATPWALEGDSARVDFGVAVAGSGDLNGDGYDDIAVGEDKGRRTVSGEGVVKVFPGGPLGLAHTPAAVLGTGEVGSGFGAACAIVGDINGDGYADLVVGAPHATVGELEYGKVYVYFGAKSGLPVTPSQTLVGAVAGGLFGASVARLGDLNADGHADVAIGSPGVSVNLEGDGQVSVFLGSSTGLAQPAVFTVAGSVAGSHLGQPGEVAAAGDVDRDGWDDMIVGEPLANSGRGLVRVYPGGANGIAGYLLLTATTPAGGAALGTAVGGRADFDGDGVVDDFYTAPGLDTGHGAGGGGVYVRLDGTRAAVPRAAAHPVTAWRAADSAPIAVGLRSDAATSFRLHGLGHSPAGRTRLALEWEAEQTPVALDGLSLHRSAFALSGPVVAGAGSPLAIDAAVTGLTAAKGYHWHARFRTTSPLFPATPWQRPPSRARSETMLFTAGAPGAVDVDPAPRVADMVALAPARPNPSASGAAEIAFTLPRAGHARLVLYDVRGRLVRVLFDGDVAAGPRRARWDGLDEAGRAAPAGAYLVRLSALGADVTEKLVRLP